jgi:fimbrial chaperone protein
MMARKLLTASSFAGTAARCLAAAVGAFSLLVAWGFAGAEQGGAGSLLVAPTRLVLEGRTRNAEMVLSNTGTEAATYRIALTFYRMGENGEMVHVETPSAEDRAAHGLLRYSPRQVTLEPGASQILRVALRKPPDLAPGEYRSHFVFTPVIPAGKPSEASGDDMGATVHMIVSVSIAVIVREGETAATATLDPPILEPGEGAAAPALDVTIRRTGNRSLYGKLVATFQPVGGQAVQVGLAKGIGVYVPNGVRHFRLSLKPPAGVTLRAGRLEVRFIDEESEGRVLASATLALP